MSSAGEPQRPRNRTDRGATVVSPAPRAAWWKTHALDPSGLVTQSPDWVDAMVETGSWVDASRCYTTPTGRNLVMPMVRRRGSVRTAHWSFGEGWGMGGVLAPGGPTPDDVAVVLDDLAGLPALRIGIRPNPLRADVWQAASAGRQVATISKRAHVLDLSGGADVVWNERYRKNGRRDVRRAERAGVEVSVDTTGAFLPVFYDLFLTSVVRWAARAHEPARLALFRARRRDPLAKLEAMARRLGPAMRGYVARVDGVPAAAVIVLMGRNAHYTRGAMDLDVAGPTSASDLVQWRAIQDACAHGCEAYHMGDTGDSVSLARFKEKVGATAIDYAGYRLERVPLTAAEDRLRGAVKRVVGFRDA